MKSHSVRGAGRREENQQKKNCQERSRKNFQDPEIRSRKEKGPDTKVAVGHIKTKKHDDRASLQEVHNKTKGWGRMKWKGKRNS